MAKRFKNHPAVLGYDLMNEPHPGSMFDAPEAIGLPPLPNSKSPQFDRTRLRPFYQRAINRIRQEDPDGWIFFEPRYGAPGNGAPSFLGVIEDPRGGDKRVAMAPHLYSVMLEANLRYDAQADPAIENWEWQRRSEVATQQSPLLIGEWGLDPSWGNSTVFMQNVVDTADRMRAGWAYWAYDPGGWSFLNADLSERPSLNVLIRTYPQKIAGALESLSFDAASKVFKMTLIPDPSLAAPTEIYVPEHRFYADGWSVETSAPDGQWHSQWDAARDVLSVWFDAAVHEATITIHPSTPS